MNFLSKADTNFVELSTRPSTFGGKKKKFPGMSEPMDSFQLLFEGPLDERPETVRKLKAAFLVELNWPLEKVQEIFLSTPTVIMTSKSKLEVESAYSLLTSAGGKITLIAPITDASDNEVPPEEEGDLVFSFGTDDDDDTDDTASSTNSAEDAQELTVDVFDPEVKTYELSFDDEDTSDIIPQLLTKPAESIPPPATPAAPKIETPKAQEPPPSLSLSTTEEPKIEASDGLSLGAPVESAELIESPAQPALSALLFEEEESLEVGKKVDEAPFVQENSTVVEMVLHDLNAELSFAPPPTIEQAKPQPVETKPVDTKAVEVSEAPQLPKSAPKLKDLVSKISPVTPPVIEGDPASQPQSEKAPPVKAKRTKISMWDFVLPILVGGPLVIFGNWYFYSKVDSQGSSISIEQLAKSIVIPQSGEAPPAPVKPKIIVKKIFNGETIYEDGSVNAQVTYDVKVGKIFIELKIQTAEPAELTPEEIGRKMSRAPWLRLIETDKVAVPLLPDNTFKGTLPGRIYVEAEKNRTRLLLPVTVSGSLEEGSALLEAKVGTPPAGKNFFIEKTDDLKYTVGAQVSAPLKLTSTH